MNLRVWMQAKAIVEGVFGIGFVILPVRMLSVYGMTTDSSAVAMTRLLGAAFLFGAIVLSRTRDLGPTDPVMHAIVPAATLGSAIGLVVSLLAVLGGVWNALGWLSVAMYLVFGAVFAYFWAAKPAA